MKWINTKSKASLRIARLPDGTHNLVLIGVTSNDREWMDAIRHMGMQPSATRRTLFRKGGTFKMQEALRVFPKAVAVDIPESEVFLVITANKDKVAIPSVEARRVRADMQTAIPIGLNYLGQEVFSSGDGSRFIRSREGQAVSEEAAQVPAAFLRAPTEADLTLCADGFVLRMQKEMMRAEDLRKLTAIVYSEHDPVAPTDTRLREVQEAVESAMFRRFSKEQSAANAEAFSTARHMENHQPTFAFRDSKSVLHEQYSTPLTISTAAQFILGDVSGRKVLDPTIGNGSLVALLGGSNITGVEIDLGRATSVADLFDGVAPKIIQGDFLKVCETLQDDFDVVIANPPFGGLPAPVQVDGLNVTRLDHLIAVKALSRRKDDGVSVLIVGGDHENLRSKDAGKIAGGSQRFFNWLCDHYEVQAIELDGSLYAKQGAGFPVRLVTVGRRRTKEEAKAAYDSRQYRLSELPIVRNHDDLWAAASKMREKFSPTAKQAEVAAGKPDARENEYQAPYTPCSKSGEPSSMIPSNLAASQALAFTMLVENVGDVDEFVRRELQMKSLNAFTPEQVDAIALAIFNARRGRALILGDQTGQGKGRVVAALARYSVLSGKDAIFLTDTPNLFSDFWRDATDIGTSDLFKPFILNDGERIIDLVDSGETVIPPTKAAIQKRAIDEGLSLSDLGYNIGFMTYSQFNRAASPKAAWLATAAHGAYLIMDESHKAAGDSNIAIAAEEAIANAWSATYSSATYAKQAKNMRIYSKAFPKSVNLDTLSATLEIGGEPLQEVLSSMLCADGVFIRREHDLSRLDFSVVQPTVEIYQRNRQMADRLSAVLSAMAVFSGDVERVVNEEARRIEKLLKEMTEEQRGKNRMGVSSLNFGSRLYTIQRQFMLALAADTVARTAIEALQDGQKPVFVLEQTMETLLKELMIEDGEGNLSAPDIDFRELLRRTLDKLISVKRIDDYGNVEISDIFMIAKDNGTAIDGAAKALESIKAMIEDLPYLSAMPLDQVKQAIEEAGYAVGEISGRTMESRRLPDGRITISPINTVRAEEVFRFNNGDADATMISCAGATGISLHSSERYVDKRQRVLIEMQIANDVAKRVQLFGRVDRRGQVSSPAIKSVTSGLPAENKMLSMQNQKLRRMSANTQSNRNNSSEMKDIPDILNDVGDEVCQEFLLEHPDIARILSIDLEKEVMDGEAYFANKLTGRIGLLPVAKQEEVYEQIAMAYSQKMAELTSKGINPFESHVFDVRADVSERFSLGDSVEGSVFDAPVHVEKLIWVKNVEPIRLSRALEMTAEGARRCLEDKRFREYQKKVSFGQKDTNIPVIDVSLILAKADEGFDALALQSVPTKFVRNDPEEGVKAALNDKADNIIKKIASRCAWLTEYAGLLMPGAAVSWGTADGEKSGLIVSVQPPSFGEEHLLGRWVAKVVVPGQSEPECLTFNQMYGDDKFLVLSHTPKISLAHRFDTAPSGEVTFSRWVLSGNLFAASEMAARFDLGRAGVYTTKDGVRHRAVVCFASVDREHITSTPEIVNDYKKASSIILKNAMSGKAGEFDLEQGFSISWDGHGKVTVTTPGAKMRAGDIFTDEELIRKTGKFSGTREKMTASFHAAREALDVVALKLYSKGLVIAIPREERHVRLEATNVSASK